MSKGTRFVGLDVHAETIAAAVAEPDGKVQFIGTFPNRPESLRKLVKKLGEGELRFCYEAGPTGYALYWELTKLGKHCEVIAPTLIPVKAGDRVKTDRRDAEKLAQCYRAGTLTAVWVPDAAHEALRDLVRAREAAKRDQLRAKHRLSKFLLRHGVRRPEGVNAWTQKHEAWLKTVVFEQPALNAVLLDYRTEVDHQAERITRLARAIDEAAAQAPAEMQAVIAALQALRGVAKVTAVTIVAEAGSLSRFQRADQLMGYSGAVPSEDSSGGRTRRGAITKTGNSHLRRVIVEAAWAYRYRPARSYELKKRQEGLSEEVKDIAWKAQHRLHSKYTRLAARGKVPQHVVTAVARELLGFIWAIGTLAEREVKQTTTNAQRKSE